MRGREELRPLPYAWAGHLAAFLRVRELIAKSHHLPDAGGLNSIEPYGPRAWGDVVHAWRISAITFLDGRSTGVGVDFGLHERLHIRTWGKGTQLAIDADGWSPERLEYALLTFGELIQLLPPDEDSYAHEVLGDVR